MANMKRCATPLLIREIEVKTPRKYHLTLVRVVKIAQTREQVLARL